MATFGLLHRLRPRGLHGRLMWLVSLVTLLTIVALGAHTLATESALALESLRGQASAMARSLALSSVNPMLTDQLDHLEEALLREMVFPGAVSAQVIDARGAILGHAKVGPDGAALLVFEAPGSRLALPVRASTELLSGQLAVPGRMVAWQPVAAGKLLGWARVETRLDPLDALNRQVWLRTLAAGALTVAGSSLLLLCCCARRCARSTRPVRLPPTWCAPMDANWWWLQTGRKRLSSSAMRSIRRRCG